MLSKGLDSALTVCVRMNFRVFVFSKWRELLVTITKSKNLEAFARDYEAKTVYTSQYLYSSRIRNLANEENSPAKRCKTQGLCLPPPLFSHIHNQDTDLRLCFILTHQYDGFQIVCLWTSEHSTIYLKQKLLIVGIFKCKINMAGCFHVRCVKEHVSCHKHTWKTGTPSNPLLASDDLI